MIGCIIEVYRTNRAHKKRIERETDESIIWSKEQATKIHESGPGGKVFGYKPVSNIYLYYIFCVIFILYIYSMKIKIHTYIYMIYKIILYNNVK